MDQSSKKIDAVFEGGGVKGSALVGAIVATEQLGYRFQSVAGTSAGALVASLIAARYSAVEMQEIMGELDYQKCKDPTFLSSVPLVGQGLSIIFNKGIFKGDYVTRWLRDLLAKKNIRTFKDLIVQGSEEAPQYRYALQVIASDITLGKMLVLPGDSVNYGINPDDLDVASAVRMSMSIPYFYEPVVRMTPQGKAYIVDGALLSNFPVWLFDNPTAIPPWPAIGYKLVDPDANKPHNIQGPITLFAALFQTMMEAHDAKYIKDSNFVRTVPIPTLGVNTTDFGISAETKQQLYNSGFAAAQEFFQKWNFDEYKQKFSQMDSQTRTSRVWQ